VGPARTGAISPVVDDAGIRFRASESIFARRANNRKVSTDTIVQWIHLLTSGVMCTCSMYRIRLNRICATDSAVSKEPAVTSAWLLFVAFMGGGCAGILLMALMRMAGDLPDQSNTCSRGWIGNDPIDSRSRKDTQQTLKVHEKTETALKDAARISDRLAIVLQAG
jgi:hypothetical protein